MVELRSQKLVLHVHLVWSHLGSLPLPWESSATRTSHGNIQMVSNLCKGGSAPRSQNEKLAPARQGTSGRAQGWPGEWLGLQRTGEGFPAYSRVLPLRPCCWKPSCTSDRLMIRLTVFKSHWKSGFSYEIAQSLNFSYKNKNTPLCAQ